MKTWETIKNGGRDAAIARRPESLWLDYEATLQGRVLSGEPPLDTAKVTSVGLPISNQPAGTFRLEVAWIKASPAGGK